jgi:hypothetical protein
MYTDKETTNNFCEGMAKGGGISTKKSEKAFFLRA